MTLWYVRFHSKYLSILTDSYYLYCRKPPGGNSNVLGFILVRLSSCPSVSQAVENTGRRKYLKISKCHSQRALSRKLVLKNCSFNVERPHESVFKVPTFRNALPVFLIYNQTVAVAREYNLRLHHNTACKLWRVTNSQRAASWRSSPHVLQCPDKCLSNVNKQTGQHFVLKTQWGTNNLTSMNPLHRQFVGLLRPW